MSTTPQTIEAQGEIPRPTRNDKPAKPASRELIVCLVTLWAKVEMNLGECDGMDSKGARLAFASQVLGRPVSTFNDLSMDEGLRLLAKFKQETGEEFKPSGYKGKRRRGGSRTARKVSAAELTIIGQMSVELFGERWDELLRARVGARFGAAAPESMSSGQGWKLVEELLNRLAVAAIAEMHQPPIHRWEIEPEVEVQRKRFFPGPVMEAP